jgi:hypothetical protein
LIRVHDVAQIFNLLYRRVALGRASKYAERFRQSAAPQIKNLRYGRLKICATRWAHWNLGPKFDSLSAIRNGGAGRGEAVLSIWSFNPNAEVGFGQT